MHSCKATLRRNIACSVSRRSQQIQKATSCAQSYVVPDGLVFPRLEAGRLQSGQVLMRGCPLGCFCWNILPQLRHFCWLVTRVLRDEQLPQCTCRCSLDCDPGGILKKPLHPWQVNHPWRELVAPFCLISSWQELQAISSVGNVIMTAAKSATGLVAAQTAQVSAVAALRQGRHRRLASASF